MISNDEIFLQSMDEYTSDSHGYIIVTYLKQHLVFGDLGLFLYVRYL